MTCALAALLTLALQDEPLELKWDVKKEDRLELRWTFAESSRHELPKLDGRSDVEAVDTYDKREVEAELYLKEDTPAGTVLMTLKKVGWSQGTHEYDCTMAWVEGKKPEVLVKIKVKDKSNALVKREDTAKLMANTVAEAMKKAVEGNFSLSTSAARPGETLVLRNNTPSRNGNSIFDRMYLHSVTPRGSVNLNQVWKDPIEGALLPPGLVEVDTLSWKVTACGPKTGATAKAGFTFPINKTMENTSAGQVTDVRATGTYTLAREYTFSPEGFLSGSKEDVDFKKKTDAKGKDAEFYKDNVTRTLKQVVAVKKKKGAEPKKDEKK